MSKAAAIRKTVDVKNFIVLRNLLKNKYCEDKDNFLNSGLSANNYSNGENVIARGIKVFNQFVKLFL